MGDYKGQGVRLDLLFWKFVNVVSRDVYFAKFSTAVRCELRFFFEDFLRCEMRDSKISLRSATQTAIFCELRKKLKNVRNSAIFCETAENKENCREFCDNFWKSAKISEVAVCPIWGNIDLGRTAMWNIFNWLINKFYSIVFYNVNPNNFIPILASLTSMLASPMSNLTPQTSTTASVTSILASPTSILVSPMSIPTSQTSVLASITPILPSSTSILASPISILA